jgi:hypothetical protein
VQKRRFLACNEIGSIISIDQHTHAAVEIEFDDKCGCAALSTLGVTSHAKSPPMDRVGVTALAGRMCTHGLRTIRSKA